MSSSTICTALLYLFAAVAIITGTLDTVAGLGSQEIFGGNLLANGVNDAATDNLFRFLGGVWVGTGFLIVVMVQDFERYWKPLVTLLGSIALGGAGRVGSIVQHGWTPSPFGQQVHMGAIFIELVLCPIIGCWLYLTYSVIEKQKRV